MLLYYKKTFFRKFIFIVSFFLIIHNFIFINNYSNRLISGYMNEYKDTGGVIIEKENNVKEINDHLFYEVVKKLSNYIIDYNANYYSSKLYDYNVQVGNFYIDNGFVFSSIKYIEEKLNGNEIILGFNYNSFCKNNGLYSCDDNYLKTILINKKILANFF